MRQRTVGFDKWCETVRKGDLVEATNTKSRFSHFVRKKYHSIPSNSKDHREDFSRIGARALCGQTGEGWWWFLSQHSDAAVIDEDSCKPCFREWKRQGSPTIRNFVQERASGTEIADDDLPFGWRSIPTSQEPRQVKWNYDKDLITFQEVKVWKRGPRIVVVGKVTADTSEEHGYKSYPMLVARSWQGENEYETSYRCTTMEQALLSSYEKMAAGGY